MDSITQALLGAAIAQAAFGNRLGPRALIVGALYGALPDIDVVSGLFGPWASMAHHRGITHSLFFAPVVSAPLGWLAWRACHRRDRWSTWAHLAFWTIFTHPLLDLFTSYGTQLLLPFTNRRFALDAIPIVDPIYSVPLLLAVVIGLIARSRPRLAAASAGAALVFTTLYLLLGWHQSHIARRLASAQLEQAGFTIQHLRAQPSMLIWMWRIVARDHQGNLRVGVISTWKPTPISFEAIDRPDSPLVQRALDAPHGRLFSWFADGMVGVRLQQRAGATTVLLDDQRYGLATQPSQAFWGASAVFDERGNLVTMNHERYGPRRVRGELAATWAMMWNGVPDTPAAHSGDSPPRVPAATIGSP